MIPALASIVAAYVIFRCATITLDAVNRLTSYLPPVAAVIIKTFSLIIIILGAAVVVFETLSQMNAIYQAAKEPLF